MRKLFTVLFAIILLSCTESYNQNFDLQGHRGARGMLPENSIPAFIYAIDQGVTTLEMDLAVTTDNQLVVSHEPYISAEICLLPSGEPIPDSLQHQLNIYQMSYEEVKAYDCGSKLHPGFPEQKKMKVSKPLLKQVIDTVDKYCKHKGLTPVNFNIEIKSHAESDGVYHPAPGEFSDLVYRELDKLVSWDRVTIQSFDFRVLQYFKKTYPGVSLALLIENDHSYKENLDSLGFQPAIYSPYFKLLTQKSIREIQSAGIKVIPWTVNDIADIKRMKEWGVDGLITDYPDRLQPR